MEVRFLTKRESAAVVVAGPDVLALGRAPAWRLTRKVDDDLKRLAGQEPPVHWRNDDC